MDDPTQKLKIFTDEHIDSAIVDQLRRADIEVLRCEDVGMKAADDRELLEYATQNGYALLSMDNDFTRLHNEYMRTGKRHAGIFFAPMAQFHWPDCTILYGVAELIGKGAGTLEADIHNQGDISNGLFYRDNQAYHIKRARYACTGRNQSQHHTDWLGT